MNNNNLLFRKIQKKSLLVLVISIVLLSLLLTAVINPSLVSGNMVLIEDYAFVESKNLLLAGNESMTIQPFQLFEEQGFNKSLFKPGYEKLYFGLQVWDYQEGATIYFNRSWLPLQSVSCSVVFTNNTHVREKKNYYYESREVNSTLPLLVLLEEKTVYRWVDYSMSFSVDNTKPFSLKFLLHLHIVIDSYVAGGGSSYEWTIWDEICYWLKDYWFVLLIPGAIGLFTLSVQVYDFARKRRNKRLAKKRLNKEPFLLILQKKKTD